MESVGFVPSVSSPCSLPTQRDDLNKAFAGSDPTPASCYTPNRAELPGKVGSSEPDLERMKRICLLRLTHSRRATRPQPVARPAGHRKFGHVEKQLPASSAEGT